MLKLLLKRTSGNIFTAISIHVAIQQTFITLYRFGNSIKARSQTGFKQESNCRSVFESRAAWLQWPCCQWRQQPHAECLITQSCSTLWNPMGYIAQQVLWLQDFSGKNTGVACLFPSPGKIPDPGVKPASLAWQADFSLLSDQESIFKEPKQQNGF